MKKKRNIGNLLDNKKFVIILSLIIAIITWTVIAVTVNPDQSVTIENIPVTISLDKSAAKEQGLDVIWGDDATVSVLVRGRRYKVGALTAANFQAVADVSNVTSAGEYDLNVSVTKVSDDPDYEIVSNQSLTIRARFDHVVSQEFPLYAQANGISAQDGFILDNVYATTDSVTLTGPQSDIERVASVAVVSDRNETISQSMTIDGELVMYDADGNAVDLPYVSYEPTKLQLTVSVSMHKTIPLTIRFNNIPDGLSEDTLKYTITPSTVEVAGSSEAISNVAEINLGFVDFRNIDVGSSFTFNIGLPAGFTNVQNVTTATVKFETDDYVSKTFTVNEVNTVNPPDGYSVQVDTQSLNVKIVGTAAVMESLTAQDIVAAVDFAEVTVSSGQFRAPIKITIPGQSEPCWAVGEYEALVTATPNGS